MALDKAEVDFLVNHVVLPPQLPQESESEDEQHQCEARLLRFVLESITSFSGHCEGRVQKAWRSAASALENYDRAVAGSTLCKETLEEIILNLKPSESILVHVKAQNAGLLLHRTSSTEVILDAFEASAESEQVIQTKGRLLWSFPGRSVIAPCDIVQDAKFGKELAAIIQRLHSETVPLMQPTSRKANESVTEIRDTTHPGLVTEKVLSLLAACGDHFDSPRLHKHVRDEVNWNKAGVPWRRSPFWLVMRVCLHLVLAHSLDLEQAKSHYKNFLAFLLARVSRTAQGQVAHDVAAIINMKAARKLSKLGHKGFDFVVNAVESAVKDSRASLERSWLQIQREDKRRVDKLPTAATEMDTHLRLPRSGPYILQAIANDGSEIQPEEFRPPSGTTLRLDSNGLPILGTSSSDDKIFLMADVEHWIFEELGQWKSGRSACGQDCVSLKTFLMQYMAISLSLYSGNSRALSIMLLAILQIWTALDSICIQLQPMIGEYSPEVPERILEPLLLTQLYHMEKLSSIEAYLEMRHRNATHEKTRILQDPKLNSFSVRYFNGSSHHQNLRTAIEKEARMKRDKKIQEWREKSNKHETLKKEAATLAHQCWSEKRQRRQFCKKCDLEGQAAALEISVDEWSLPQNECQLKAAVFELDCPIEFAIWRDSTYAILQGLGREDLNRDKPPETLLSSYELLRHRFLVKDHNLTLGSTNKSFLKSHYRSYKFPRGIDEVCLHNALYYRLVDHGTSAWVADQDDNPSFHRHCVTKLPQNQYSNLQTFADTSSCAPNAAIAKQSECHSGLNDHEFIAFASLRAGERTQMLNVLRELGSADLTFGAEAVHILIRQTVIQAGQRGKGVRRVAHEVFRDTTFCDRLLDLLHDHLEAIKGNWKEQHRLATLALLGLRVLSLTTASAVVERAAQLLRSIRRVALVWSRQVSSKLPSCSNEGSAKGLRTAILRIAMTCRMTFDVDPQNMSRMLASDEDILNLVETSILIQSNQPIRLTDLPHEVQRDILLNQKLSRKLEQPLKKLMTQSSLGVNQALGLICGMSNFAGDWAFPFDSGCSWTTNETAESCGGRRQRLHYNLLTGELLIDGQPLGRLPSVYTQQSLYRRVFGSVHLGLHGGELLIKAIKDGRVLRIIPHEVFHGDLPHPFEHDFVHWMNMEDRSIHFRPVNTPWTESPDATKIKFDPDGRSSMQMSGGGKLVESRSSLGRSIHDILEPIECTSHVVITESTERRIWIEMPRFGLRFVINKDGRLESQQLSATVAQEQDIGCMFGLRNKLILEATGSHVSLNQKSLLVPFGSVSVGSTNCYKSVNIETGSDRKLRFVQFYVNNALGTLQGGSDITEILFRAYLHAVTTFVLPDPLTRHTGTSEALSILQDQRLKSSFPLTEEAIEILSRIAALTPKRNHYPRHLKKMQQIGWNSTLDQLAQHEGFEMLAREIFLHNSGFSFLSEPKAFAPDTISGSRGHSLLLERAYSRNSSIRNARLERGAHQYQDETYKARDREIKSSRALRAYDIASLILEWPPQVTLIDNISQMAEGWATVSGYHLDLPAEEMNITKTLEFPVVENWGYLYSLCRACDKEDDRYRLLFLFTTLDFDASASDPSLRSSYLRTLLGIAFSGRFKTLMPPHTRYNLSAGKKPQYLTLQTSLNAAYRQDGFRDRDGEDRSASEHRYSIYDEQRKEQRDRIRQFVESQWPCDAPRIPPGNLNLLDVSKASQICKRLFTEWNNNRKFFLHLCEVESILRQIHSERTSPRRLCGIPARNPPSEKHFENVYPSLMMLLGSKAPPKLESQPRAFTVTPSMSRPQESSDRRELRQILAELKSGGNDTRVTYVDDLLSSLEALENATSTDLPQNIDRGLEELLEHREQLLAFVEECMAKFCDALRPIARHEESVWTAGLWPRITSSALLKCLSPKTLKELPGEWKHALLVLGEAVSSLQRSERLVNLGLKNNVLGFYKESSEAGRRGWSSGDFPDWLLIEVENNLTIREVQAVVALKMISPESGSNSVLQLNMGEGKSSVITPMAVAALANRDQIARLIVLKPLLKQTNSLLTQRLGGLVDRAVYHTHFSRDTKLDQESLSSLRQIYEECKANQDVLLALPEQILSFRLMGREKLHTTKHEALARSLVSLDHWLGQHCRDVLDESDELLDSKFQLVYSMGNQQHMDGQPDRWVLIQGVFSLILRSVRQIHSQYLENVQVEYRGRSFPFFTFLKPHACARFLHTLVQQILQGNLIGVSFDHCSPSIREAAEKFISERNLTAEEFKLMKSEFASTTLWDKLHLLRGLFAHKILDFTMQHKLWLVNYGLALDRCLMAVPYRAKGVPSQRAEFGHPDVALTLTCLSYYYSGLTSSQLGRAFEVLMAESDPESEYVRWTKDCSSLKPELHSLEGLNLDDVDLWESEIFPGLRFSKAAADFYMSRVVFPREGKEFPSKLSLSAWDLPSSNEDMITTGFSGTNDNKSLLPSSIHQHDLPQLQHTNAMVIELLLKNDNRTYFEAKNEQGRRLGLDGLLRTISRQSRKVQVLIDVGAQVLEAGNEDVAKLWLRHSPESEAAVFFNESDDVMVIDRQSRVEYLSTSPFKNKLDQCVTYLDEVHTRGVDLHFPTNTRAAVTLGTKLTKDRLVQGCMRMRKLGCNQSLVFFAPPEVHQAILATSGKSAAQELDSADVVRWSLAQTCSMTDVMKPLYTIQGLEFCHRVRACSTLTKIDSVLSATDIASFNKDIREPEARKLEEMYGAEAGDNIVRPCLMDEVAQKDPVAQPLIASWNSSDPSATQDFVLQEEQEREIAHEVEQEREVEKARAAKPLPHALHQDVVTFVKTGTWQKGPNSPFYQAFEGLKNTSAYKSLRIKNTCQRLFVTKDFVQTVKHNDNVPDLDQFLRPAKWVVSSTTSTNLVIISPFEANELLPMFQTSTAVTLHIYSASTSKKMRSFSDLSFYTITGERPIGSPSRPLSLPLAVAQLDIFAGCLFLKDYDSYLSVCDFLGLVARKDRVGDDCQSKMARIATDGFADREARALLDWPVDCPFLASPLAFLRALTAIRRKGQAYAQTHLGSVANACVLTEGGFEEV
ncbi:hypothetical protein BKA80DRAFT_216002 [Phyllosticta citrichinensis]